MSESDPSQVHIKRLAEHANPGHPVDAKDICRHAEAFHTGIVVLTHQANPEILSAVAYPSMVLSAFSAELWFKCIIFIEKNDLVRGHLLFELFKELSPSSQSRLTELWTEWVSENPVIKRVVDINEKELEPIALDFEKSLESGSDAFRELRYVYENKPRPPYVLFGLPLILRRLVSAGKRRRGTVAAVHARGSCGG